VKLYLGITGTTYDAAISGLVAAASDAVESYCRRRLGEGSYTEYHDGGGKDRLVLAHRPVVAVANVWDDPEREFSVDALLEEEEYTVDPLAGILRLMQGRFFAGVRNVKVEYTAGYDTTPGDISHAAVLLAATWFREGREATACSKRRKGEALPEAVMALLRPYREAAA
jgi:hypothetical protein